MQERNDKVQIDQPEGAGQASRSPGNYRRIESEKQPPNAPMNVLAGCTY
jgi:hypothetical protein